MKGPRIVKKKSINSEKDPYMLTAEPPYGSVCKRCGSVYRDKRWSMKAGKKAAEAKAPAKAPAKAGAAVLCPACRKIKDKFAEGFVTIKGDFLRGHREEILNMIRNNEEISMHVNPLARIIEIKEKDDEINLTTTTDKLAQKIGRMLKSAFNGSVEYKWSSDVKLARVVWTRGEPEANP
jgi:NMD protein affecting ribosome stability and mRNA decay